MAYSLANSYVGESLLSGFNWMTTPDPSNGYVRYKSQNDAASMGLFAVDSQTGVVRLGVDSTNQYSLNEGRPSIRIESKEAYNHGLFIADFLHMPPSQCGVWPAFWAYGPGWPDGGEIDIIEGANTAHRNLISAHTAAGCRVDQKTANMASGSTQTTDCFIGDQNIGCGFVPADQDTATYGDTFNAVGGGVYAMNWDSDYIKVWHFDRSSIPADIKSKNPDPEGWGKPDAVFGGSSCDVDNYFKDMSIVLNINFCGDYGNAVWNSDGCSALAPTCSEWVANNPAAFANAYWDINYIDAYVQSPNGGGSSGGSEPFVPSTQASSKMPKPGNSTAGERTTTTTMTSHTSTTTLTVPGGPVPTTDLPSPSKAPVNPASLDDYSYLGCFGSSDDFKAFSKVGEAADMSLQKCISLCDGIKFAGVFDTSCYCTDKLGPNTRATGSDDMCDMSCPGNNDQFCGGWAKNKPSLDSSVGAKANLTSSSDSASSSDGAKVAPIRPALNSTLPGNSTGPVNKRTAMAARSMLLNSRSKSRREAADRLFSVYAAVVDEEPPKPAPAMGASKVFDSTTTIVTTITYKTVYPLKPSEVVDAKFVATIEDCGCTGEPELPMTTTVVVCAACGPGGEDKVTLTVPHSTAVAPQKPTNTPIMPTHTAKPAPPSQVPVVVGSASSVKIGSTIAFAMLAMAVIL